MSFQHGKSTAFKLDNAAGALQDLSAYLTSISFPEIVEVAESTTFQSTGSAKTYVVGLADATVSGEGNYDPTLDTHMSAAKAALLAGTVASLTFEYGPQGSAGSAPKYTGECLITSYERQSPVGDLATVSFELQVTGAVTKTTF